MDCWTITGATAPGAGQSSWPWPSTCPTSWLTRYCRYVARSSPKSGAPRTQRSKFSTAAPVTEFPHE
ncbi:Uncharacterised protein [Mycobacteroides abscessus]|nr:Uncharacterised protein [Mycobacteroides abscessus]